MYNKNKLDEIKIEIESKMKELDNLYDEYEELNGEVKIISMLHFDNDKQTRNQLRGYPHDIYNLFYSNQQLLETLKIAEMFDEKFEDD